MTKPRKPKPRATKKTPKRAAYAGAADRVQTHYDGCWKNHRDCFPPDDAYGDVPRAADLEKQQDLESVARIWQKLNAERTRNRNAAAQMYDYRAEWEKVTPKYPAPPTRWERFVAWLKARLA